MSNMRLLETDHIRPQKKEFFVYFLPFAWGNSPPLHFGNYIYCGHVHPREHPTDHDKSREKEASVPSLYPPPYFP